MAKCEWDPQPVTGKAAATKKKGGVSSKYERGHALEKGFSAGGRTASEAITSGWDDWIKRQEKSAAKRKNGSIKDMGRNASRASGVWLRAASSAPDDAWDAIDKVWKKSDLKLFWP